MCVQRACVRQSYFRIVLGLFQPNSPQMFLICQTRIISNYWKHLFWLPRAVLCCILCNRSCGFCRRMGSKSLLKARKKKKPCSQNFLQEEEKRELTEIFPIPSPWKRKKQGWRWRDEGWKQMRRSESDAGRDSSFLIWQQSNQDYGLNMYRKTEGLLLNNSRHNLFLKKSSLKSK